MTVPVQPIMGGTGEKPDLSRYRRYIESALVYSGGTHTYDDVVDMIAAGHAMLWAGPASIAVTEIVEYPQMKTLHVFLAGGEAPGALGEMEKIFPIILDWAKSQGCQTATFIGRRGWERTFLGRTGWDFSTVMASKDL